MLFVCTEGVLLNCKRRGGHSLNGSLVSPSYSCIAWKLLFLQYSHKKHPKYFFRGIQIRAVGIRVVLVCDWFVMDEQPLQSVCSRTGWVDETLSVSRENISL